MAEVAFAKTFLTTIDSRPIKLSADHVEDAKNFPSRPPYILPRMPREMSKPNISATPGQERSITVVIKSLRNPPLDLRLTSQPLSTSMLDVKAAVAGRVRVSPDRIKILHNKRPVQDSKVLKDLLAGDADSTLHLAVMVVGGESTTAAAAAAAGTDTQKGEELGDAFWVDLNGFIAQRLGSQATADKLSTLFKSAWQSNAGP